MKRGECVKAEVKERERDKINIRPICVREGSRGKWAPEDARRLAAQILV